MTAIYPVAPITDVFMPRLRIRLKGGHIGHGAKGVPEFVSDSFPGLNAMHAQHKSQADRNVLPGKSRRLYIQHWPLPLMHGWVDPLHKMPRHKRFEDMTDSEIERLEAHWRGHTFKVHTLASDMIHCAALGIHPKYEPKSRSLAHKELWVPVKAQEMEIRKTHPSFRTSGYTLGRNAVCIAPMRAAGIPTSRIKRW